MSIKKDNKRNSTARGRNKKKQRSLEDISRDLDIYWSVKLNYHQTDTPDVDRLMHLEEENSRLKELFPALEIRIILDAIKDDIDKIKKKLGV